MVQILCGLIQKAKTKCEMPSNDYYLISQTHKNSDDGYTWHLKSNSVYAIFSLFNAN